MIDASWLVSLVALAGAIIAGVTARTRPHTCFAVLFLLASCTRATLETPLGTMRMEMPAIALVATILFVSKLPRLRAVPIGLVVSGSTFAVYLATIGLSSALVAPGTAQSLRMVAWLGLSMLSGLVAFGLLRPAPTPASRAIAATGGAHGLLGIGAAVTFLLFGPAWSLGIQDPASGLPRVYGLSWETNLYASFLAMVSFFALEELRVTRQVRWAAVLGAVAIGVALGMTRGAWIGLAFGSVAYLVTVAAASVPRSYLVRPVALTAGLLVLGVIAAELLLPDATERAQRAFPTIEVPAASATLGSGAPAGSGVPGSSVAPSPTPRLAPLPSVDPVPDTIAFRLERVPVALNDLHLSPVIGLGAVSFGQLHPERQAGSGPDHIALMAIAVPYESGLVGAIALGIGFLALLWTLVRFAITAGHGGNHPSAGMAAAYVGSIVAFLVAYQSNNALHLAINWMVMGAGAALVAGTAPPTSSRDGHGSPTT